MVDAGIEFAIDRIQLNGALQIARVNAAIDARSLDCSRQVLQIEPPVDQIDLIEPRQPGNGDRIFDGCRVVAFVVVSEVEVVIVTGIFGANGNFVLLGANFDPRFVGGALCSRRS